MVVGRLVTRAIGFVSILILARLLIPQDFGLIALATSLLAVLEAVSEFGFEAVLIRNQKARRSEYDTAWTLCIIKQCTIGIVLAAFAVWMAAFFSEPRLEPILYVLAVATALDGLFNIGSVDFIKHFRFRKQFAILVIPKIAAALLTVVLAIIWRNYWALLFGILSAKAMRVLLSYALTDYRPRISFVEWRQLLGVSKWLLVNNGLTFLNLQLDTLILGRIVGVGGVGIFSLAKEIAFLATTELIWPLLQATLPGLAKLGNDPKPLGRAYLDSLAVMCFVGVPMGIGIALTGDIVVDLVLGPAWSSAIPLIQVLGVCGAVRVLSGTSGQIYLIVGKTYLSAFLTGFAILIGAPLIYFAVHMFGLIGAAYAILIVTIASVAINAVFTVRTLAIPARAFIDQVSRPIISTIVMAILVYMLREVWGPYQGLIDGIALLLSSIVAGGGTFLCFDLWLWMISGRVKPSAESRLAKLIDLRQYSATSIRP